MRKFTRNEKIKITERAKTILIILLACSCFASGYYVFDMYRDLDGVRSFWQSSDPVLTLDGQQTNQGSRNVLEAFLKLSEPELILINKADARGEIPVNDKSFAEISEVINAVIREAYLAPEGEITVVDMDEWKSAVGAESLYAGYAGMRTTVFESEFYKITQSALSTFIDAYSEVCLVPETGFITVYIPDEDYKNIAKIRLATNAAEKIDTLIKKRLDTDAKAFVFAFELGLDAKPEAEWNAIPMLVIPSGVKKVSDITVDVPKVYKTGLNFMKTTDFTLGLIDIFGYNQNTVRQYVNSEDVLIFVGETGTLSVYPEGYVEYRTLATNEGVVLDVQSKNGVYGATAELINIIERINMLSGVLPELNDGLLKITAFSVVYGQTPTIKVEFDYYVDGCKVGFDKGPAVSAIINDGVLTELRMQIKTVKKDETQTNMPAVLDEIGAFVTANPQTKFIMGIEPVYRFNADNEKIFAEWVIQKGN